MYSIYALSDPRSQEIRYVGMSNNVQRRFLEHVREYASNATNKLRYQWLTSLKQDGLEPLIEVLETTDDPIHARMREKYWIEQYIHLPLTNASLLSDAGRIASSKKGTLVYVRHQVCINQAELALMSGVSQVVISRCERGHPISRQNAQSILDTLNAKRSEQNERWKNIFYRRYTPNPLLTFDDLNWKIQ